MRESVENVSSIADREAAKRLVVCGTAGNLGVILIGHCCKA